MVKSNIHIIKNKVEEKCVVCNTFIDEGETCISLYSKKEGEIYQSVKYHNVKLHIGCEKLLSKEISLVIREKILDKLG